MNQQPRQDRDRLDRGAAQRGIEQKGEETIASPGSNPESGDHRPSAPDRHLAEHAAASVMTGALENASEETDHRALIQETAAHLLRGAGDVDANVAAAVRGAVIGAIDGSPHAGLTRQDAAQAAAIGALEAAAELGAQAAVEHVKRIVTAPVRGIRPLDESAFARGRRTP